MHVVRDGEILLNGLEASSIGFSTLMGASAISPGGKIGTGLGVTATVISIAQLATDAAEVIPVLGQGVALLSIAVDLYNTVHDISECPSGGG